jgi:hypothetical protein
MGRLLKIGLRYFPFEVDFFDEDEIQYVSSRFDEKGELIAVKLMCKIFRTCGYYMNWDDDAALLFSKGAGRNITPSLANDVVNELVKRGFFDKGLFERFSVITSKNIQATYKKICTDAKRKEWKIRKNLALIELTPEEMELTPEESTQSKVKEIKGKETKELEGGAGPPKKTFKNFTEEDFIEDLRQFKEEFEKDVLNSFFKYWKEKSAGGKMRFQLEKTWETKLRLEKWKANNQNFKNGSKVNRGSNPIEPGVSGPGRSIVFDKL